MSENLVNAYQSLPVTFTHGEGCYLWDSEGRQYLDALCGISVTSLGHNCTAVTKAICEQAGQLLHCSNLYTIEWQQRLARLLCETSGMQRAFFGNSGAEANEAAIKIARLYGHQLNIKNPQILVMNGAFHGRTMATLSATGSRKVQAGFEPLVTGFQRAPFDDIAAVEAIAANNRDIVAVMVEPIQGEAGVIIPREGYLQKLRQVCDDNNWLLMLDEVQSGMARSGEMYAFQHEGILPDVMTLAKALGNGVPIGACMTAQRATDLIKPGNHGSTFGGNPLASRVACAVIKTILDQNLASNAAARGRQLRDLLVAGLADHSYIKEIRQIGLLIGIELDRPCAAMTSIALEKGLLINVTAEQTVRLLPPLIINHTQTEELATRLIACFNQFMESS